MSGFLHSHFSSFPTIPHVGIPHWSAVGRYCYLRHLHPSDSASGVLGILEDVVVNQRDFHVVQLGRLARVQFLLVGSLLPVSLLRIPLE